MKPCACGSYDFLHKQFVRGFWVSVITARPDGMLTESSSPDELKSGKEPKRVMCLGCGKMHPNPLANPKTETKNEQ